MVASKKWNLRSEAYRVGLLVVSIEEVGFTSWVGFDPGDPRQIRSRNSKKQGKKEGIRGLGGRPPPTLFSDKAKALKISKEEGAEQADRIVLAVNSADERKREGDGDGRQEGQWRWW
ncbi:hypothetical protein NL676_012142 [Syzygium grande]|nr:hypothetical protein NL676_012142 [Syzygium grande]